ncbi:ABC-2 type transport system permease protein [Paucidesulfovibrio gracilis DSM 16080]|uniref:ABC-2 type transport system permease protein n=1 Tax=Paucidesulfovibrio gracilis DSM 16080 TaxID=1121449 RepID=A0A1T4WAS0_9BACT|nr:ABC transporter permease [Paucidesulfovibrio gracilis]SKA74380.1 ABC-2 type transport system permease protein [Paucidesulfovibrio gracilis DSM 16080]
MRNFSWSRFKAVVRKEFVQMRRDRLTFAMLIGIPLVQLVLFGYAINADPRHLPTAVLSADNSPYSRAVVAAMQNSDYFTIRVHADSREQVRDLLRRGEVQFALTIPPDFGRDLIRGQRPVLLMEADATDPVATGGALKNLPAIVDQGLDPLLRGPLEHLRAGPSPVTLRAHADFNPEAETQYNIVPGLMGVILTLTLTMITSLAITREQERGTMENLLTTPVRPLEVTVGKILPYVMVGYIQVLLILTAAALLFHVPMHGSVLLLLTLTLIFIGANLSVGVTISTMARNQLQAVQMSIFFFLPSLLLSGFMFPFRGMPQWAQYLGSVLPLTHYLRLVRGILLKGNGAVDSLHHTWPILLFWAIIVAVGLKRFRQTLD